MPIYAGGRPHPLRDPCSQVLLLVAEHPLAFSTDAEVVQELLHRFLGLHQWERGKPVFDGFVGLMEGRVKPLRAGDVVQAALLADRYPRLSVRDLVHVAVMQRIGSIRIISADQDFSDIPQLQRLDPANLAAWRQQIEQQS
ncbi:MAG: type II toxin-antitoxin system VapC family toxin [Dehalococcoidia bacterium]